MNTKRDPREIAETILLRSICSIKVGACISDSWGVHSWAWNNSGRDGFGEHAEAACIRRSNRDRLSGSTIYVAAIRSRNDKVITACPCLDCAGLIRWAGIRDVWFRDGHGIWRR